MILQTQRVQNVRSKMDSTPSGVARNSNQGSWMKDENMCRSSDCVSIAWDLALGQRIAKKEPTVCPIAEDDKTTLLHSNFSKKEATICASDATTSVATMITQGGLPVVRIKTVNDDLSLSQLPMLGTGSSISYVNKSIVSTLQLQGQKPSFSVAGIHGSQDVKTEKSADSGFSTWEVSTIDYKTILC